MKTLFILLILTTPAMAQMEPTHNPVYDHQNCVQQCVESGGDYNQCTINCFQAGL